MTLTPSKKLFLSVILFLIVVGGGFTVMCFMTVSAASDSLVHDRFEQLRSVRELKKKQIEQFFAERRSDMDVLAETVGTLRKEAFDKLTAVREVKRAAIERHFNLIHDQIITFSQNKMVIDAMRRFRNFFRTFRSENGLSTDKLKRFRSALLTYYTEEFSKEYIRHNTIEPPRVEDYYRHLDNNCIALQYYYIKANNNPLGSKHLLDRANDKSRYSELHSKLHPVIRNYLDKFGYYDIFLIDSDTGNIIYSVFKELDYGTSLIDGPFAHTNLGKAFRKANLAFNRDAVVLMDYARYSPSYEAPASFIASPIFDGNKKIGIAAFQMPIDRLNTIMGERAGLGKTGETYLIGRDKLMRSDSYLDPENHSVIASFRNPETGKVETEAAKEALSGQTGAKVIIDYNSNPVLSAYTPIKIGDLRWALLAEIDVAEAFCPANENGDEFFAKYKETYGYYDLFLVNPDGYCFYTVAKEADYQTNFLTGKFSDSNLGRLIKRVINTKQFGMADFESYAPSKNEPAAFIAMPIVHNRQIEAVVALQLSIDTINAIMQERTGMGKTGESYLIGSDKLMRSDSYLDPINHSVNASFASPDTGSVDTEASSEALAGKTGEKIVIDYNGNPVLSAYAPLKLEDITWALIAEIDVKEVVSESVAAQKLLLNVWKIGVVSILIILVGAVLWGFFIISGPLGTLRRNAASASEKIYELNDRVESSPES